jgi:hypothetical protein
MAIPKATLAKFEEARLAYLQSLQPKRPGEGWFTSQEYADAIGIARKCAHLRLCSMLGAGFAERKRVGRCAYWRSKP